MNEQERQNLIEILDKLTDEQLKLVAIYATGMADGKEKKDANSN